MASVLINWKAIKAEGAANPLSNQRRSNKTFEIQATRIKCNAKLLITNEKGDKNEVRTDFCGKQLNCPNA